MDAIQKVIDWIKKEILKQPVLIPVPVPVRGSGKRPMRS